LPLRHGPHSVAISETAAIIVAAGRGERFGSEDKILLPLLGRPVLAHVLDAIERTASVSTVVVVTRASALDRVEALLFSGDWLKTRRVVSGGSRRQDSVAAGLKLVPDTADLVLIHDAARPLVTPDLIDRCIAAALPHGAIAAIPVTDTLKQVGEDGRILRTIPREALWAAQTPQVYPREKLRTVIHHPAFHEHTYTDEAALFEIMGWSVAVVPGDPDNIKVTWPGDLERAEAVLQRNEVPRMGEDMRR
jgi:2-C-methyl-D-erythritol 4-phosphate cytidylyltransferase